MLDTNRLTKQSVMIIYKVDGEQKTFPLPIINKIRKLSDKLKEWEFVPETFMSCCGDKVVFSRAGGYTFKPSNDLGPWKNTVSIRSYEDKVVVIAAMCFVILMRLMGFYCQVSVNNENYEVSELWQTAWSIIMDMLGGEYDKIQDDEEVD